MWAIILHGGAKQIEAGMAQANRSGCLTALEAGKSVLVRGGSAADAVEAAIRVLEDDATFNCGYGSALNADGDIEMCAAIMEGGGFEVGAVSAIRGVRHPISVAKAMLHAQPVLVTGEGARRFAAGAGAELCDPDALKTPGQRRRSDRGGSHDTVGCLALDAVGRLAAGTSTGGLDGSPAGRVGDSPQPGCGYYADDAVGAVAFSGDGEHIARKILAARVMFALGQTGPDAALGLALEHVAAIGGEAGGIVLTPDGRFGWRHNSPHFAVAFQNEAAADARFFICREDEGA